MAKWLYGHQSHHYLGVFSVLNEATKHASLEELAAVKVMLNMGSVRVVTDRWDT